MDANRKELNETLAATCQSFISQDEANKKQLITIADDLNSASLVFEGLNLALQSHQIPPSASNALTWLCKSGLEHLEAIELRISEVAREPEFRARTQATP